MGFTSSAADCGRGTAQLRGAGRFAQVDGLPAMIALVSTGASDWLDSSGTAEGVPGGRVGLGLDPVG
jgi:hypothetical protein